MTAGEIIGRAYKGKSNFMTPDIIRSGRATENIVYELSQGNFTGQKIFGVTFVKHDENLRTFEPLHEISSCCHSITEAENLIRQHSN